MMNRVTYMELAGRKYPLVFSLGAAKEIAKRCGNLEEFEKILKVDVLDVETMDTLGYVLAVLAKQGCAYKNKFEKDIPPEPGAYMEDGKYVAPSQEEIEMCVGLNPEQMITPILEALAKSTETELETESKNEKAPKGG